MRRRALAFWLLLAIVLTLFSNGALAATPNDWSADAPELLDEGHLYAQTALVMDADTGDVLFEKDSLVRMYPASTTKIMTLLLALESGISMDTVVTIPEVAQNVPSDSSTVPVYAGEKMTFQDLLYGFMLTSGNDGANAIAYIVGGSIENFVAMMNARAAEIGCTGTHFSNAHGYHDDTHFTTAMDLALIAREAMRNPTFRQIVSTPQYTMAPTVNRGEYTVTTSSEMIIPGNRYYYEDCIGIKTGYHSRAGHCFVGAGERDGIMLITVAMRSAASSTERAYTWQDTLRLLEYGFSQYEPYTLEELFDASSREINTVSIANAARDDAQKGLLELRLTQLSDGSYQRRVRSGSSALAEALADFAARSSITFYEDALRAPIDEGEILGTLTYTAPNGEVVTGMLAAQRAVEAKPEYATLYDVLPFLLPLEPFISSGLVWVALAGVLVLVVVVIVLRARKKVLRNRYRAEIYKAKRREYRRMEEERRREMERRRKLAERRRAEIRRRRAEQARRAQAAGASRAHRAPGNAPRKSAPSSRGSAAPGAARRPSTQSAGAKRRPKPKDPFEIG